MTPKGDERVKDKVYLETTIVSYLCARPSRDLVVAAHQQITHEWWSTQRSSFDLYTSVIVLDEVSEGDPEAASLRLEALQDIPILELTDDATRLMWALLDRIPLPKKAAFDAFHIALASVNNVNYLVTWNCAHLANATLRHKIGEICGAYGYTSPIICTPEELMEIRP